MVIERIVRETSLSEGDVSNALISLNSIVCDVLKILKIVFTLKQRMRDAANSVKLSIDRPKKETASSGTSTEPGSGNEGSFG